MRETTANMYRLGWDERNGGNISYMLETEQVAEYLDLNKGLEAIFRSTVIGLQKYESDFRLLYQIDHTDLDRYNENLRNQLEDEMSVIVNLL